MGRVWAWRVRRSDVLGESETNRSRVTIKNLRGVVIIVARPRIIDAIRQIPPLR
jgi:hypothetical protein